MLAGFNPSSTAISAKVRRRQAEDGCGLFVEAVDGGIGQPRHLALFGFLVGQR